MIEPMLEIDISSKISLSGDIEESVIEELKDHLIMANPKWVETNRMGYSTKDIPQTLSFIKKNNGTWEMPRGFIYQLVDILLKNKCYFVIDHGNKVRKFQKMDFNFNGELWEPQKQASKIVLQYLFGVVSLPTGSGKTVMALYCIAQRRQPALVIVHTKELLYQWKEKAEKHLGLNGDEIGLIGDGEFKIGKKLTIAIINSLRTNVSEVKERIGYLIVDECHKVAANTFKDTVKQFDCQYMLGLSATPERSDGLTRLIPIYLGNVIYNEEMKELQEKDIIMQPKVYTIKTGFFYPYSGDYQAMISALIQDPKRNNLISQDVMLFTAETLGIPLVVSDRKEHCYELKNLISKHGFDVAVLTGNVSKKKRREIINKANSGEISVLIATTTLIAEGFDCKRLTGLFITTPMRAEGKEQPEVFDYVDDRGLFQAQYRRRLNVYRECNAIFA